MFSELVDRAVHVTGRPDTLDDVAYWANETMRDICRREDWMDDSIEELIELPAGQTSMVWTPGVGRARYRRMDVMEDGCGCTGHATKPTARLKTNGIFSYYHSQGSIVVVNACNPVMAYYYAYQPWLAYYARNQRPTTFDVAAGVWTNDDPAVIDQVSNWMLERHSHVVLQGTLAKFFASKQDPRQGVHYSAYEQGITHIIRGESIQELLQRNQ